MEIPQILRLKEVLAARGISRSSHYVDIKKQVWTPPVRLGLRAVGWPLYEVRALIQARVSGKSDIEIQACVQNLLNQRYND
ncbi:MAG: AlpA family phage regulatory protein [Gammaproteobacteria bacterium]|nr:AlpA family phage regulatory protein [Gammaproteobacteria bacterium]MBU0786613.1 AlpA family phage regulatory protein [Gammaproteobacteria bacterium]MBU0814316.1 AlpA family phage regulatory protein [Gammaproteobacteria bacterium]MBU1786164.1 AlpA family phage regulatory protein [Gammaproteobacteria bacterium]